VAGVLEPGVEVALDLLPDRVAVRLDHHAALDHLGGLGELAEADHVLVPLRVVVFAPGDRQLVLFALLALRLALLGHGPECRRSRAARKGVASVASTRRGYRKQPTAVRPGRG